MKFLGDFFGFAAAFDAELLEDVDDMRFDGGDLDTEDVGDLLVLRLPHRSRSTCVSAGESGSESRGMGRKKFGYKTA